MLIPIGLLLGGAVRSMLPVWIFTGRPIVPRDARIWIQVSGAALMIAWMTVLSRRGAIPALAGGTALLMVGMLLGVSVVRTLRRGDAHPAR